ncbi:MAG: diguanylate cyclase [Nitrospirota bacterium]
MLKLPGSLSLFRKLVLASVAAGLLPMILGFSMSYISQRDTLRKTMGSAFRVLARETGVKLGLLIHDLLDRATDLARSDRLAEATTGANRRSEGPTMDRRAVDLLEAFRLRSPLQYHLIILTDREGRVIGASPRQSAGRQSYRGEMEWEAAFDGGKGKPFVGDITWDPVLSAYTLNMAVPVRRNGEMAGVLLLIHTVDRLFKSVTDVHIGRTDHTMLASSDGSLLFCPIFQIKNHTLAKSLSQEIFKKEDGWSTTRADVHYPGREAINGFSQVRLKIDDLSPKSLGGRRWAIFTSQDPKETYEPLRSLLGWTALSAGMGVLILVVLAILAIRTIVRPITLLQTKAHEIIQGIRALPMDRRKVVTPHGAPEMNIDTGDEVKDLAEAFSEMVGTLESSRRLLTETTRRLEEMAITDELTGLYNRRYMMEELKAEFSRSMRFGLPLSCLAIDLDFFKEVNDRCGHLAGDEVLRQISDLFHENFREPDILARIGGEEFLVILPQTDIRGALAKGELLRGQVERHAFTIDHGETIRLTISIGAAAYPDERIHNTDHLLKVTDDALYRSKETGRNRVSRG